MFVFYFVGFHWRIILDVFGWLCFEIGSNISNNLFLKLVLHMSWIVIFCTIFNSSMDHKHDKVMYMLCMFKHMLSCGYWRSIIKLSNVCTCAQKPVKQKARAKSDWYLLIMNVLEVLDSDRSWWYWKLLDMVIIDMTFLKKPFSFMFYRFMLFSWQSKLLCFPCDLSNIQKWSFKDCPLTWVALLTMILPCIWCFHL
jgi:hypothetical protein